jgi:hypothetical protein
MQIAIIDVFDRPGLSDLAIVQLKHVVQEHADYGLGDPISAIELATTSPEEGDPVKKSFTHLNIDLHICSHCLEGGHCWLGAGWVPGGAQPGAEDAAVDNHKGGEYVAVHRCLH